jgi:hypothetical protein
MPSAILAFSIALRELCAALGELGGELGTDLSRTANAKETAPPRFRFRPNSPIVAPCRTAPTGSLR